MLPKKSLSNALNLLSVPIICAVLLSSVLTTSSKAMDGELVELMKKDNTHKKRKVIVEALQKKSRNL